MREGGFTGLPLAYKLNTYKVLTIQYKYMLYEGSNELKFISDIQDVAYDLPESPLFLLCDTFPAGGSTKSLAIKKIKEKYPSARFIFASLVEDKTSKDIDDIIFSAFAIDLDNEGKSTQKILVEAGVKNAMNILLPWENEVEELSGINGKKWEYN
jgi:hypothetical protein